MVSSALVALAVCVLALTSQLGHSTETYTTTTKTTPYNSVDGHSRGKPGSKVRTGGSSGNVYPSTGTAPSSKGGYAVETGGKPNYVDPQTGPDSGTGYPSTNPGTGRAGSGTVFSKPGTDHGAGYPELDGKRSGTGQIIANRQRGSRGGNTFQPATQPRRGIGNAKTGTNPGKGSGVQGGYSRHDGRSGSGMSNTGTGKHYQTPSGQDGYTNSGGRGSGSGYVDRQTGFDRRFPGGGFPGDGMTGYIDPNTFYNRGPGQTGGRVPGTGQGQTGGYVDPNEFYNRVPGTGQGPRSGPVDPYSVYNRVPVTDRQGGSGYVDPNAVFGRVPGTGRAPGTGQAPRPRRVDPNAVYSRGQTHVYVPDADHNKVFGRGFGTGQGQGSDQVYGRVPSTSQGQGRGQVYGRGPGTGLGQGRGQVYGGVPSTGQGQGRGQVYGGVPSTGQGQGRGQVYGGVPSTGQGQGRGQVYGGVPSTGQGQGRGQVYGGVPSTGQGQGRGQVYGRGPGTGQGQGPLCVEPDCGIGSGAGSLPRGQGGYVDPINPAGPPLRRPAIQPPLFQTGPNDPDIVTNYGIPDFNVFSGGPGGVGRTSVPFNPWQVDANGNFDYRSSTPNNVVAFSGSSRSSQTFFKPGKLMFDDVITNIGGAFNYKYGVFTAPVSGIYMVDYHAASNDKTGKPAILDLLRNDRIVNSARAKGAYGMASNSAILYLNRFDRLSVRGRTGTAIFCETGHSFCSFNVALLRMGMFSTSTVPRGFPAPLHKY